MPQLSFFIRTLRAESWALVADVGSVFQSAAPRYDNVAWSLLLTVQFGMTTLVGRCAPFACRRGWAIQVDCGVALFPSSCTRWGVTWPVSDRRYRSSVELLCWCRIMLMICLSPKMILPFIVPLLTPATGCWNSVAGLRCRWYLIHVIIIHGGCATTDRCAAT